MPISKIGTNGLDQTDLDLGLTGNVGIGTSTPAAKLHVSGISLGNSNIRLTNTFTNGRSWELNPYASGVSDVPFTIRDVTAGADRITIDSSGNVGIGGTGSGQRLFVDSGAYLWTTRFTSSNGVATALEVSNSTTRTWEFAVGGNTPAGTLPAGGMYFYDQSAGAARLTIDTSGRVSMPAQVGFKVGRTSPAQTVANGGACIFNTTATSGGFNTGSAYNTSTGNFTAPISGRYIFNATVIFESVANGTNFADIILTVNGGAAAYGLRQTYVTNTTGSGGFFVDKISVILNLVVGDVVAVINNTGTSKTLHANPGFAIFDGYLLG